MAKDSENNLKLDTQAGAVPQRVYLTSESDEVGEDAILSTLDLSCEPFTNVDRREKGEDLSNFSDLLPDGTDLFIAPGLELNDMEDEEQAHFENPIERAPLLHEREEVAVDDVDPDQYPELLREQQRDDPDEALDLARDSLRTDIPTVPT